MTAPYGGGAKSDRGKSRNRTPVMSADDSVMVEAYGTRGAAARKTAAKIGESQSASPGPARMKASFTNAIDAAVSAVKRVTGRAKTDRKP